MRLPVLFFLFIHPFLFAQKPIIDLKIDSVTASDSVSEYRKFVVKYHVENRSDKKIAFLLDTTNTDSIKGVKTNRVEYNLYQDNVPLKEYWFGRNYDYSLLMKFINGLRNSKTEQEEEAIKNDPEFKKFNIHPIYVETLTNKRDPNYKIVREFENRTIYRSMKTLEPNETQHYELTLYWNKERYFKNDDSEFYLSDDHNYYLELTFTTRDHDFMFFNLTKDLTHDESLFFTSTSVSNKVALSFDE